MVKAHEGAIEAVEVQRSFSLDPDDPRLSTFLSPLKQDEKMLQTLLRSWQSCRWKIGSPEIYVAHHTCYDLRVPTDPRRREDHIISLQPRFHPALSLQCTQGLSLPSSLSLVSLSST